MEGRLGNSLKSFDREIFLTIRLLPKSKNHFFLFQNYKVPGHFLLRLNWDIWSCTGLLG